MYHTLTHTALHTQHTPHTYCDLVLQQTGKTHRLLLGMSSRARATQSARERPCSISASCETRSGMYGSGQPQCFPFKRQWLVCCASSTVSLSCQCAFDLSLSLSECLWLVVFSYFPAGYPLWNHRQALFLSLSQRPSLSLTLTHYLLLLGSLRCHELCLAVIPGSSTC